MADVEQTEKTIKTVLDEEPRPENDSCRSVQDSVADAFLDLARLQAELLWDFDGEWSRLDRSLLSEVERERTCLPKPIRER
jgi:hypothetical protein